LLLIQSGGQLRPRHFARQYDRGPITVMRLTPDEQSWLDAYCQLLKEQYPSIVTRMVIYGSKARGDDHPDSDLDILLIVKNEAAHLKRQLRRHGYELAATSDAVPSILAYTQDEWESRKKSGSPFQQAIERDAVSVL
jgi:predicted nucleotidyltransferase